MATSKGRKYGTGALPPPEMAWVMGKTAASILFVRDAEDLLAVAGTSVTGGPLSERDIELLRNAIAAVKAGRLEFKEETTACKWLARIKKPGIRRRKK